MKSLWEFIGIVVAIIALGTPALGGPACKRNPGLEVADFSIPVTELKLRNPGPGENRTVLQILKDDFGIKTIFRYYDKQSESIPCKTLLRDEVDAIFKHGMSVAVVFQHQNDKPETFLEGNRGAEDAIRSLQLAKANGQPFGSTIYFGVDGVDEAIKGAVWEYWKSRGNPLSEERKQELKTKSRMSDRDLAKHIANYTRFVKNYQTWFPGKDWKQINPKSILPKVQAYFRAVRDEFQKEAAKNGGRTYDIGGYGSGLVCKTLLDKKEPLVKHCWLAQSTGWPEYEEFKTTNQWGLLQQGITKCPGWVFPRNPGEEVEFDFNKTNPKLAKFGQWSSRETKVADIPRPDTCKASK